MFDYEFSRRENTLIIILAICLMSLFYYNFAYVKFKEQMNIYNTESIEDKITIEEAKAFSKNSMLKEIDKKKNVEKISSIPNYNAQADELKFLTSILDKNSADDVSFIWEEPYLDKKIVRRNVNISFTVPSYECIKAVMAEIKNADRRSIVIGSSISKEASAYNVSFRLIFFESIEGNVDMAGLDFVKESEEANDDI